MDADALAVADQPGRMLDPDDSWQSVLACDHGAMSHEAADLRHQTFNRDEQRRPTRVRVRRDQDVPWFECGVRQVQYDAGSAFDDSGGNGQANERAVRKVVTPVGPGDGLAVRREHPRRRERVKRLEGVFALAHEMVIDSIRTHDVAELVEGEEEDVFLLAQHTGAHEAL